MGKRMEEVLASLAKEGVLAGHIAPDLAKFPVCKCSSRLAEVCANRLGTVSMAMAGNRHPSRYSTPHHPTNRCSNLVDYPLSLAVKCTSRGTSHRLVGTYKPADIQTIMQLRYHSPLNPLVSEPTYHPIFYRIKEGSGLTPPISPISEFPPEIQWETRFVKCSYAMVSPHLPGSV